MEANRIGLVALLLLCMLVPLFAGGQGESDAAKSETVEISVEIFDRGNVPEGEGTYEDNRWTRWVNERMNPRGIAVKFVPIPRGEATQKLNILLAAGDAPDLSYSYNNTEYHKWAESGGLLDLTDLVDQYAPNVLAMFENKPGVREAGLHRGRLYCVRGSGPVPGGHLSYIRKDWLRKVGLDMPTSPEELYTVLKAFKEQDPAGVGVDNVVPWTVAMGGVGASLMNEALFSAYNVTSNSLVDGELLPNELNPGFEDYLIYMNRLYKEDLIDQEFPLDTSGQRSREHIAGNLTGLWHGNWNWINSTSGIANSLNHIMVGRYPEVEWVAMDAFPNKDGVKIKFATPDAGMHLMVPKASESVAVEVVRYMDWLAEEGGYTLFTGFEGEHYEETDGVRIPIDLAYNENTLNYARWDYAIVRPFEFDGNYLRAIDPNTKFGQVSFEADAILKEGAVPRVTFDRAIEAQVKYGAALEKILEKWTVAAITGDDPSRDYRSMVDEYLSSGGQEVIDERTAVYREMRQ